MVFVKFYLFVLFKCYTSTK